MKLNKSRRLSPRQYFTQKCEKTLITLHHTVGGVAQSTINYWNKNKDRVGTAFIIERDGTIYDVFPPEYWAGHHGVKGDHNNLDKRSIGIELCNFGPIYGTKGNFKTEYNASYKGGIYLHESKYRHSNMFEIYPCEQMDALCWLVNDLLEEFPSIPRDTPLSKETDYSRFKDYEGIIGHFHVRVDKSDVHPGFDWGYLKKKCNLNYDQ